MYIGVEGVPDSRGINWLAWDKLCVSKEDGGLGFKNLFSLNLAMLGKQWWKFIYAPNALLTRIFKAKYFLGLDFMGSTLGHNPSFTW